MSTSYRTQNFHTISAVIKFEWKSETVGSKMKFKKKDVQRITNATLLLTFPGVPGHGNPELSRRYTESNRKIIKCINIYLRKALDVKKSRAKINGLQLKQIKTL